MYQKSRKNARFAKVYELNSFEKEKIMKLENVKKDDIKFGFKPIVATIGVVLMLSACANSTPTPHNSKKTNVTKPSETDSSKLEEPRVLGGVPTGTFEFDMKSTLKANGEADEQMTYLLKNMSKDIKTVAVAKGKKVTLVGENREGKARKQTFECKTVSENSCKISAGRGMTLSSSDTKHIKLEIPMQNGKLLYLHYNLKK